MLPRNSDAAHTLLTQLADALVQHHAVTLTDRHIVLDGVVLANVRSDGRLRIAAAIVFDGHEHVVPKGMGDKNVTPGRSAAKVEKLVDAVLARVAARKAGKDCPHWADNQGFCHRCGVCVTPGSHGSDECASCAGSATPAAA